MLDMGWTELLLIGVVALIVVGPKDLPRMLRTLGQYTGKLRGMAREFQRSMDDAAREADMAELKDIKGSIDDVRSIQSDTRRGMSKLLTDAEQAIDSEVDLEQAADKPDTLAPTQPLPTPRMPTPASNTPTPTPDAPPSAGADAQGTPPKTGTDA